MVQRGHLMCRKVKSSYTECGVIIFWDALVEIVLEALLRELVDYTSIELHGLRSQCEC